LDGHSQQFAAEIPERDLAACYAMNGDSMIAPEIRDSPHHLGRELVDIEWILSNQHFAECIQNCILRSEPSDVVMTLADAMDACVGFDFDQRHGVTLHPDPHYLHVCDFDFPALLSRQAAERGDHNTGRGGQRQRFQEFTTMHSTEPFSRRMQAITLKSLCSASKVYLAGAFASCRVGKDCFSARPRAALLIHSATQCRMIRI